MFLYKISIEDLIYFRSECKKAGVKTIYYQNVDINREYDFIRLSFRRLATDYYLHVQNGKILLPYKLSKYYGNDELFLTMDVECWYIMRAKEFRASCELFEVITSAYASDIDDMKIYEDEWVQQHKLTLQDGYIDLSSPWLAGVLEDVLQYEEDDLIRRFYAGKLELWSKNMYFHRQRMNDSIASI